MTDIATELAAAAWQLWGDRRESTVVWFLDGEVTLHEVPGARPLMLSPYWSQEDLAHEIRKRVLGPSVKDHEWWRDFMAFWRRFGHEVSGVPFEVEAPTKGRAAVRAKGWRL